MQPLEPAASNHLTACDHALPIESHPQFFQTSCRFFGPTPLATLLSACAAMRHDGVSGTSAYPHRPFVSDANCSLEDSYLSSLSHGEVSVPTSGDADGPPTCW